MTDLILCTLVKLNCPSVRTDLSEIFVYTHSHLKHLVKNIESVLTFGGNHNGKRTANKALNQIRSNYLVKRSGIIFYFLPISFSNFDVIFSNSTSHSSCTLLTTFLASRSRCSINCLYSL